MKPQTIIRGSNWNNPQRTIPEDKSSIIKDLSRNIIYCYVCKEQLKIVGDHIDREIVNKFRNEHKKCKT